MPSEDKRKSAARSNSTTLVKMSNRFHRGLHWQVLPQTGDWLGSCVGPLSPIEIFSVYLMCLKAHTYAYLIYRSAVSVPVDFEKLSLHIWDRKRIGFKFSATPFMPLLTTMHKDWPVIRLIQ